MFGDITISTADGSVVDHPLSEDEQELLEEIVDIEGEDAVIVSREDVRGDDGDQTGEHLTITADTWKAVTDKLNATEGDR